MRFELGRDKERALEEIRPTSKAREKRPADEVGFGSGAPHLQSQGKAPSGRGWPGSSAY